MTILSAKIINIVMGGDHVLALRHDSSIVAWGSNDKHQCDIPAHVTHVLAIAAGYDFSMALLSSGRIVAWGNNEFSQCTVPVSLTHAIAIAAGLYHAVAVTPDGAVIAWGQNTDGQCDVPRIVHNVKTVAAGAMHSLALTHDGHVYAWGNNDSGQCDVPVSLNHVIAIAAGKYHSLAVTCDGDVIAWGYDKYGQCSIPSVVRDVVSISTSESHVLACTHSGHVFAWGSNSYWECYVPDDLTNVVAVSASNFHSLALHQDGSISAWGGEGYKYRVSSRMLHVDAHMIDAGENHSVLLKQQGLVEIWPFNRRAQCDLSSVDLVASFVAAGDMHSLAITSDNRVYAWGSNDSGQCDVPSYVVNVVHVAAGGEHSLAVTFDGRVYAWGNNAYKQCSVPTDLTDVISVAAGKYHSLALRKDGRTVAWGMFVDLHNQTNVVHIAAAEYYSLAVTSSGTVLYGGWDRTTPTGETLRLQSAAEVTKVSVGGKHSLALTKQGHVEAWGLNDSGQCDVPVWLTDVDQIAAGGPFSLAKLRDGNVVTWGGNSIIDIQSLVQIGESKKLEYVHPFLQGQGGEAQLYSTPSGLLKRYISPDKTPATGKFEYMMKYPIIFEPYQRPLVAWPKQMAFDPFTGELVGYVMPFISAMQLQYLIDPLKRYRYFPELTSDEQRYQQFVFTVSSWCAKVLDFIHSQQYIVGDLSPRNIMIYPDMTVAFIDCASYQIKDSDEYGCYVGTPDYQAPEVNRLPDGRLQYTVHSDAFALAVVIFRLMSVHNVHPYQGITLPSAKLMPELYQITKESYPHLEPISDDVDATSYCEEHRIWPYDPSQRICVPPVAMQSQYALLPSALRTLFRRAFTGAPNQRPTPLEWAQTIDEIRMQHS